MPSVKLLLVSIVLINVTGFGATQSAKDNQRSKADAKVKELEFQLEQLKRQVELLSDQVRRLTTQLPRQKGDRAEESPQINGPEATADAPPPAVQSTPSTEETSRDAFFERIVEPDLGGSLKGERLKLRPEIFIQTRYSTAPLRGSVTAFDPNFRPSRVETTWEGQVSERFGLGFEIQYHAANDGTPEQLVNDAYIEYYLNDHATVRVGQFIVPFGFDIQQSSSVRESPERGMFSEYFFPGERDRGVMLLGDLNFLDVPALENVQYFVDIVNGNRQFADNNRQVNYVGRLRKVLDHSRIAIGVSAQVGKQLLPPGVRGNNNQDIIGADVQYAVSSRFGLRGEVMAGNMPSTSLSIQPQFLPAFLPGRHSSGGALLAHYRLNSKDNLYARYDQFNGDPATGKNIRALNFGYFRMIGGERSRISFDYQFKNRPSFNEDAINGRFNISYAIKF
jgi:hypothetical protein